MNKPIAPVKLAIPKHLRLVKADELVKVGDFVANERQEFELWEGPGGFLAAAFIKPIYREEQIRSITTKGLR